MFVAFPAPVVYIPIFPVPAEKSRAPLFTIVPVPYNPYKLFDVLVTLLLFIIVPDASDEYMNIELSPIVTLDELLTIFVGAVPPVATIPYALVPILNDVKLFVIVPPFITYAPTELLPEAFSVPSNCKSPPSLYIPVPFSPTVIVPIVSKVTVDDGFDEYIPIEFLPAVIVPCSVIV